jgi:enterobacterial common antigen flippase
MTAVKAAFDSAVATVAKLAGALVSIKILAVNFGPDGMGQLGQFMSVVALLSVMASGGCSIGVSKYVAQLRNDSIGTEKLIKTASWISVLCCIMIAASTIIWANTISKILFGSSAYASTLQIGCIFLFPLAYSTLGFAVINGLSATSALAGIQIGSAVIGAGGLALAVLLWQLKGAAIGLLWMSSSAIVFIVIWWIRKKPTNLRVFIPKLNKEILSFLMHYSALTVMSIIFHNFSQIVIRNWLYESAGWSDVGYWQAMTRISDAYLQMINVFLISYLLPKLSCQYDNSKAILIIHATFRFILPAFIAVLVVGYFLRDFVIDVILSSNFYFVRELFLPQMMGDFFKIAAYIPGYLILARGFMPLLFLADPIQIFILLILNSTLIPSYGAVGACWAYFMTYFLYFSISYLSFCIFKNINRKGE